MDLGIIAEMRFRVIRARAGRPPPPLAPLCRERPAFGALCTRDLRRASNGECSAWTRGHRENRSFPSAAGPSKLPILPKKLGVLCKGGAGGVVAAIPRAISTHTPRDLHAHRAQVLPTSPPLTNHPPNHLQHPIKVFINVGVQDANNSDPKRLDELLALQVVFQCARLKMAVTVQLDAQLDLD